MTLGDRICVMKDGDIMQVAEPLKLYNSPENMFVAGFIGSPPMNFLHGSLVQEGGRTWFAEDNPKGKAIKLRLTDRLAASAAGRAGRGIVFGIRPEDIADALNVADPDPAVCADAKVEVSEPMGAKTFLYLESGAHSFIAKVHSGDKYDINQDVRLRFDMDKAHLFDPETEKVLRA
jgi:multiple sugar transport system ATP-binding protein